MASAVSASAGKNASMDSSATVTSTAVPKAVIVLMNVYTRPPRRSFSGVATSIADKSCVCAGSAPG